MWPKRIIEALAGGYALGQVGSLGMAQRSARDSEVRLSVAASARLLYIKPDASVGMDNLLQAWMVVAGGLSLVVAGVISTLFGLGARMLARELKTMPTEQAAKVVEGS